MADDAYRPSSPRIPGRPLASQPMISPAPEPAAALIAPPSAAEKAAALYDSWERRSQVLGVSVGAVRHPELRRDILLTPFQPTPSPAHEVIRPKGRALGQWSNPALPDDLAPQARPYYAPVDTSRQDAQMERDRLAQQKAQEKAEQDQRNYQIAREAKRTGRETIDSPTGDKEYLYSDEEEAERKRLAAEKATADKQAAATRDAQRLAYKRQGRDTITLEDGSIAPVQTDEEWTAAQAAEGKKQRLAAREKRFADELATAREVYDIEAMDRPVLEDTERETWDRQRRESFDNALYDLAQDKSIDKATRARLAGLLDRSAETGQPIEPGDLDPSLTAVIEQRKPDLWAAHTDARNKLAADDENRAWQDEQKKRIEIAELKAVNFPEWKQRYGGVKEAGEAVATTPSGPVAAKPKETAPVEDLTDAEQLRAANRAFERDARSFEENTRSIKERTAAFESQNAALRQEGFDEADWQEVQYTDGSVKIYHKSLIPELEALETDATARSAILEKDYQKLVARNEQLQVANDAQAEREREADEFREIEESAAFEEWHDSLASNPLTANVAKQARKDREEIGARYDDILSDETLSDEQKDLGIKAIQKEEETRRAQVQESIAASSKGAEALWKAAQETVSLRIDQAISDTQSETKSNRKLANAEARARVEQISQTYGFNPGEAAKQVLDYETMLEPWRESENKARVLPVSGVVIVNPSLAWSSEKYAAAVEGSDATPEAKQAAMAEQARVKQQTAPLIAAGLRKLGGFRKFEERTVGTYKTETELIDAYFESRSKAGEIFDSTALILQTGSSQIVSEAYGNLGWWMQRVGTEASKAKGDEMIADLGSDFGAFNQANSERGAALKGLGVPQFVSDLGSGAVSTVPSLLAGAGGSVVGTKVLGALAKVSQSSRLGKINRVMLGPIRSMPKAPAGVAIGRFNARQANKMAQQAGLYGAGGGAYMQSFGSVYPQAYAKYLAQGMSEEDAEAAATGSAMGAGAATAGLTIAFGRTGVEKLIPGGNVEKSTMRALAQAVKTAAQKKQLRQAFRSKEFQTLIDRAGWSAIKDTGGEAIEEGSDQFIQGLLAMGTYESDKTLGQVGEESLYAALIGSVLGGAFGGVASTKKAITESMAARGQAAPVTEAPAISQPEASQEQATPALNNPEPIERQAISDAEIDNWTGDGTLPLDEVEATKARVFALRAVAQGRVDTLTNQELTSIGLTRDESGKIKSVKSDTPPLVSMENGVAILSDEAIGRVRTEFPQTAKVFPASEAEARAMAQATAKQTPAEQTPAEQTPAEQTPAEQTPAEQTPAPRKFTPEERQRIKELAEWAQTKGLDRKDAVDAAAAHVRERGITDPDYAIQAVQDFWPTLKPAKAESTAKASPKTDPEPVATTPAPVTPSTKQAPQQTGAPPTVPTILKGKGPWSMANLVTSAMQSASQWRARFSALGPVKLRTLSLKEGAGLQHALAADLENNTILVNPVLLEEWFKDRPNAAAEIHKMIEEEYWHLATVAALIKSEGSIDGARRKMADVWASFSQAYPAEARSLANTYGADIIDQSPEAGGWEVARMVMQIRHGYGQTSEQVAGNGGGVYDETLQRLFADKDFSLTQALRDLFQSIVDFVKGTKDPSRELRELADMAAAMLNQPAMDVPSPTAKKAKASRKRSRTGLDLDATPVLNYLRENKIRSRSYYNSARLKMENRRRAGKPRTEEDGKLINALGDYDDFPKITDYPAWLQPYFSTVFSETGEQITTVASEAYNYGNIIDDYSVAALGERVHQELRWIEEHHAPIPANVPKWKRRELEIKREANEAAIGHRWYEILTNYVYEDFNRVAREVYDEKNNRTGKTEAGKDVRRLLPRFTEDLQEGDLITIDGEDLLVTSKTNSGGVRLSNGKEPSRFYENILVLPEDTRIYVSKHVDTDGVPREIEITKFIDDYNGNHRYISPPESEQYFGASNPNAKRQGQLETKFANQTITQPELRELEELRDAAGQGSLFDGLDSPAPETADQRIDRENRERIIAAANRRLVAADYVPQGEMFEGQRELFAGNPNQRSFDFGTSGDFGDRDQMGFNFQPEDKVSPPSGVNARTTGDQGYRHTVKSNSNHPYAGETFLIDEIPQIPPSYTVIRSEIVDAYVGPRLPFARLSVIRDRSGELTVLVENGRIEPTWDEQPDRLRFERMPLEEIGKNKSLVRRADRLWETEARKASESTNQPLLFASNPNQRFFDFGTSGDLSDNPNQLGFDFSAPARQSPTPPPTNDLSSSQPLERDRPDSDTRDTGRPDRVPPGRGTDRPDGGSLDDSGTGRGLTSEGSLMPDDLFAALGGDRSDREIRSDEPGDQASAPGSDDTGGSGEPDADGLSPDHYRDGAPSVSLAGPEIAGPVAGSGSTSPEIASIRRTAPALTPDQAGDVAFLEKRFAEHPGALLTNGTGTGKTFSGLGWVARELERGSKHILIVAPSDKVCSDWVRTAKEFFQIDDVAQLTGVSDNGAGNRVVVTTYANLGQNSSLVERPWTGVVTDEAHYLSQSKQGDGTIALESLRALTAHQSGTAKYAAMKRPEPAKIVAEITKVDYTQRTAAQNSALDQARAELRIVEDARKAELAVMARKDRPKALLLSATPFAHHFSLDYGEGYLYDYPPENKATKGSYRHVSPRSQFYIENLGYRIRYGKLTSPENATAVGIMERRMAERLMREGAMAGRRLDVPLDYGREFVLTETKLGERIDEIISTIRNTPGLSVLSDRIGLGTYLERRYLFEGLKVRESVERIRKHLAMGRQVVVFHDYKKGGGTNPLPSSIPGEVVTLEDGKYVTVRLDEALDRLKALVPHYEETRRELGNLISPIDLLQQEFGEQVGVFNGSVPKAARRKISDQFNAADSGMDIILVQRASGKEGISLHDTVGDRQRVIIDLGFPARPTDAIQCEGRIYRMGVKSPAIFEYLTTGTDTERWTFAQTIAQRASTAENLAMGEQARALLQAFADGYNNAESLDPRPGQGFGGKEGDAARHNANPFTDAVALYYANQKRTSRNKSAEGKDYFATPEPLGYKMVEWADIRPGDKVLEPSAGHGAIARFFPDATNRHAVEPSFELLGRLALNATDLQIHQSTFEDYDIHNKFNVIVMNPPFGTAGKTAMDHVAKATRHLRDGGRVVALIPDGPSMDKRFDAWMDSAEAEGIYLVASYGIPAGAFERAGTGVKTRVVILDKSTDPDAVTSDYRQREFAGESVEDFFAAIKDSTAPLRPEGAVQTFEETEREDAQTPAPQPVSTAAADFLAGGRGAMLPVPFPTSHSADNPARFSGSEGWHAKKNTPTYVATINTRLDRPEYDRALALAKQHGGYYSAFKGAGAVPGFQFPSPEARDGFLGEALQKPMTPGGSNPNQRYFDFGVSGDLSDNPNQLGFDFSIPVEATVPETPAEQALAPATIPSDVEPEPSLFPMDKGSMTEAPEKIADFGEKIGGARKDKAQPLGPRTGAQREKDETPAWRKGIVALEEPRGGYRLYKEMGGGQVRILSYVTFPTLEAAENGIALAVARSRHGVKSYGTKGEYAIYRKVGGKKYPIVKGGFATRDAAADYIETNPVEIIEHRFAFPEKPHLDWIDRTPATPASPYERQEDTHITPTRFQEVFGFRGGEFGNWNQGTDGQAALDHAYDALLDLAGILNLPPKAISLNGELAVAFGARGTGGKKSAVAHYETDYRVINLTKIWGAGSLAHEWFHAVDHYFYIQSKEKGNLAGFVTAHYAGPHIRAEVSNAFLELSNVMLRQKVERAVETKEKFIKQAEDYLKEHLDALKASMLHPHQAQYNKRYKPPTEEQLAAWDQAAADHLADPGEGFYSDSDKPLRGGRGMRFWKSYEHLETLAGIYKKVTNSTFLKNSANGYAPEAVGLTQRMLSSRDRMRQAAAGETEIKTLPTEYSSNAQFMDRFRASNYWSTAHEMSARAFEAYVTDKLTASDRNSQYLVNGAPDKTPTREQLEDETGEFMFPYPYGTERAKINQEFDRLFETVKTEETDKGIRLYASNPNRPDTQPLLEVIEAMPAQPQAFLRNLLDGQSIDEAASSSGYGADRGDSIAESVGRRLRAKLAQRGVDENAAREMIEAAITPGASNPNREDARYLELAKDPEGNREELQAMVDGAARAAGYNVGPVSHGTGSAFDVFNKDLADQGGLSGPAFYFTTSENEAVKYSKGNYKGSRSKGESPKLLKAFLKTGRAFNYSTDKLNYESMETGESKTGTIAEYIYDWQEGDLMDWSSKLDARSNLPTLLKNQGFSSTFQNRDGGIEYAVFNPSQIKSADPVTYDESGNVIPLSQRFNPASDSILYASNPNRPDTQPLLEVIDGMPAQPRAFLRNLLDGQTIDEAASASGYGADRGDSIAESVGRRLRAKPAQRGVDDEEGRAMVEAAITPVPSIATTDGRILEGPKSFILGAPIPRAYHGTPHKVDKFTTAKIGTGEGAQVYGWGLYFAEAREIGEQYRKNLTAVNPRDEAKATVLVDGIEAPKKYSELVEKFGPAKASVIQRVQSLKTLDGWDYAPSFGTESLNVEARAIWQEIKGTLQIVNPRSDGNLYTVKLLPDDQDLLDWDKPLREQSEIVKSNLANIGIKSRGKPYKWQESLPMNAAYIQIAEDFNDETRGHGPRLASEALFASGIKGIRYRDGASRQRVEVLRETGGDRWYVDYSNGPGTSIERKWFNGGAAESAARLFAEKVTKPPTYNYVIFSDDDIEIVEENGNPVSMAQAIAASNPNQPRMVEPGFYSQLAETIEQKIPSSATPQQILATIDPARGSGVKEDEIKWSGLRPALERMAADNGGKVPKVALLEYLANDGAVRFEEVTKSDTIKRFEAREKDGGFAVWDRQEKRWDDDRGFPTFEAAQRDAEAGNSEPTENRLRTEHSEYQLPGGEHYREIVLAMPEPEKVTAFGRIEKSESGRWRLYLAGNTIHTQSFATREEAEEALEKTRGEVIKSPKSYTSSHFPTVPNYVAHMRVNERTDSTGAPGLFIEELQSDRHQEGRKKGYKGENQARYEILRTKWLAGTLSDQETTEFDSLSVAGLYNQQNSVADAPFRKDWSLQLFKRALRDAVASGKDWIGWTVGETQKDRFDLSKQVEYVKWSSYGGPVRAVEIPIIGVDQLFNFTTDASGIITKVGLSGRGSEFIGKPLSDVIGKEIASKVMSEPSGKLQGDGLKVGGSGMKGFYDDILPKEIGKYVKQWGGSVEKVRLNRTPEEIDAERSSITWPPRTEEDRFRDNRLQIEYQAATRHTNNTEIHRVTITPQMRASVQAGQKLFASNPNTPTTRPTRTPGETLFDAAANRVRSQIMSSPTVEGLKKTLAEGYAHPLTAPLRKAVDILLKEATPLERLPTEVRALMNEMRIKQAFAKERAMDVVRSLSGKAKFSDLAWPAEFARDPGMRVRLYNAMAGLTPMGNLPPEIQKFGAQLRERLKKAGLEAVRQGRMHPDTYLELVEGYMPHYYIDHEQAGKSKLGGIWQRMKLAMGDVTAQQSTMYRIKDMETKDRRTGEKGALVTWDEKGKRVRFRDAQHRNGFYEGFILERTADTMNRARKDLNITPAQLARPLSLDPELRGYAKRAEEEMRKRYQKGDPLTEAQQDVAGLIRDPVYAVARYISQMEHDNATAAFFNGIADSEELLGGPNTQDFIQLPENPKLGKLGGKFVAREVAEQIIELIEVPSEALQIYDALLTWWKTGKTVYNPGTHVRNVLGNLIFAKFAGVDPRKTAEAWKVIAKGGPKLEEMFAEGVLGSDFLTAELRNEILALLPMGETVQDADFWSRIGMTLDRAWQKSGGAKIKEKVESAYRLEDEIFKATAYLSAVEKGMTPSDAAAHVRKWFPYYDHIGSSTSIRALKRTGMPFFSFEREAIRILANAARERPITLAASMALPMVLSGFSAMLLGLDDEEYEEIRDTAMRGKGKYFGSEHPLFSILLPVRNTQARLQQWDMTNVMPFAGLLGQELEIDNGLPPWQKWALQMIAGSPVTGLALETATNTDTFRNQPIWEENMTPAEKRGAYGAHVAAKLLPPLFPGGTSFRTLTQIGERTTNKSLEKRDAPQAIGRAIVGLDVRNASPDIYALADRWREENGIPREESSTRFPSTPEGRSRANLFAELVQDEPDIDALAQELAYLKSRGNPIETDQDLQRLLFYRNPVMIIKGKENQDNFVRWLSPEGLAVYQDAQQEFRRIQRTSPIILRQARARAMSLDRN